MSLFSDGVSKWHFPSSGNGNADTRVWGVLMASAQATTGWCCGWPVIYPFTVPANLAGSSVDVIVAATGTEIYNIKLFRASVETTIGNISITGTTATITCAATAFAYLDDVRLYPAATGNTAVFSVSVMGTSFGGGGTEDPENMIIVMDDAVPGAGLPIAVSLSTGRGVLARADANRIAVRNKPVHTR